MSPMPRAGVARSDLSRPVKRGALIGAPRVVLLACLCGVEKECTREGDSASRNVEKVLKRISYSTFDASSIKLFGLLG